METLKLKILTTSVGLWLIAAPWTFGFINPALVISDFIVASLLIVLGLATHARQSRVFPLIIIALGAWLSISPLVFWAKSAAAYINATLIGFIVMSLAFSFPGMRPRAEEAGADCPPGWTINPSSFFPRTITMLLAVICWLLSRYLSSYQLGYISQVWDPFFSPFSTEKVLSSYVAKMLPISDAGLGAFCYSLEVLFGLQGGRQRWRTMPWIVLLFGILIVPAGIVSIVLIIMQPVLVKAWCGICITIAVCMLIMVVLTLPELFAVLQLISQRKKYNLSLTALLFKGLAATAAKSSDTRRLGITPTWPLITTLLLGIVTAAAPGILQASAEEGLVNFIAGPLIITFSFLAFAEVFRLARLLNIIIGLCLLLAPWMHDGGLLNLIYMNSCVAILVILFSLPKGKIRDRYGKIDKWIV